MTGHPHLLRPRNIQENVVSSVSISSTADKAEQINTITNTLVIVVPTIGVLLFLVLSGGEKTDARMTIGDWSQTTDDARHIVFRADRAVSLNFIGPSAPGASETGVYTPNIDGMGVIDTKSGRRYTVTFREFTPNQFDLQDQDTGGVTVFKKAQ
jgi:hypothetical protein